jgi:hypothetical protein
VSSGPTAPLPAVPPASSAGKPGTRSPTEQPPGEIGGPPGPEPTRYGDWEKGGRCSDF